MGGIFSRGPSVSEHFRDKVVWITGASSGLGRSMAIASARSGAKVVLSARDEAKLQAVKQECIAAGGAGAEGRVLVKPLDIGRFAESNDFKDVAAEVAKHWGGVIDVIVQNAGVGTRSPASDTKVEVDIQVMNVNFFGPVALTKAALPYLRKSRAGQIVVINSVQGKFGMGCRTSYSASKHAMTGYFDSLRAELSVEGIGVTAIYPGYIKTALSLNAITGDGSRYARMDDTTAKGLDPDELADTILRAVAAGKKEVVAAPLDARAAVFFRNLLPDVVFKILASKARKALQAPPAGGGSKRD